jgi:hypothetical protein
MPVNARLLIIEQLLPEHMTASPAHQEAARMDLHMLLVAGGRERTEDEYRRLLHSAGLGLCRTVPAALHVSVIEAMPI